MQLAFLRYKVQWRALAQIPETILEGYLPDTRYYGGHWHSFPILRQLVPRY